MLRCGLRWRSLLHRQAALVQWETLSGFTLASASSRRFHSSRSQILVTLSHLSASNPIAPQQQRSLVSSSQRHFTNDEDQEIVLYRRNHSRLSLTRTMFGFFTFHSAVWFWYAVYFLPTLDLSNEWQTALIPACGLTFSSFLQFLGTAYPLRLVSMLSWKRQEKQLLLYPYDFPFIQQSKTPKVMKLGDLYLDPTMKETQKALSECRADLSQFVGHLVLSQNKTRHWYSLPYLLDIRESDDVPEPEMLLEALMKPENMKRQPTHQAAGAKAQRLRSNRPPGAPTFPHHPESKLRNIVRKRTK